MDVNYQQMNLPTNKFFTIGKLCFMNEFRVLHMTFVVGNNKFYYSVSFLIQFMWNIFDLMSNHVTKKIRELDEEKSGLALS